MSTRNEIARTKTHRTAPDETATGWPSGVPYIIGNEGCERFSYYGMRAILTAYLVHLFHQAGFPEGAADARATAAYHSFVGAAYLFPILGAIAADRVFGKYNTILWLSIIYTFGHLVLSLGEGSLPITYAGLTLIAVGTGGIKPCVSAHVGDQFGLGNRHLLGKMYQLFYFIINFGSLFSIILIPWMKNTFGWSVAFALPGILMSVATICFWMGRNQFVHVPANPGGRVGALDLAIGTCLFIILGGPFFIAEVGATLTLSLIAIALLILPVVWQVRQRIERDDGFFAVLFVTLSSLGYRKKVRDEKFANKGPRLFAAAEQQLGFEAVEGHLALWRIMSIFVFVVMFWALFDQQGSTWVLQARDMDLNLAFFTFDKSQIPFLNPGLVMILIPLNLFVFARLERAGFHLTMLHRMTVGMLMSGLSFVAAAIVQEAIDAQGLHTISVAWQFPQYLISTEAEVLVSITGLEFAYRQSPKRVKSTVMSLWLLTVFLGNVIVSWTAGGEQSEAFDLASFFWGFAVAMIAFGTLFALRARFYDEEKYAQAI